MGISAIIHTYNSEKYLEECLQSVKECDEIIICDMHSTDNTIEIANKFGCRIIYHENVGYADPARNFALEHAQNDWILVVDSDEIVPEELLNYLKDQITKPDCPDVFTIPRKNFMFGRWIQGAGWYPGNQTRFFRKGFAWWPPYVHCYPETKGTVFHIPGERTDLAMIHYNYDSIESFISRLNKYTSLEAEKYVVSNKKFSLFNLLFRPLWVFIRLYFLKKGYADGMQGFMLCYMMAFYRFSLLAKVWDNNRMKSK